MDDIIKNAKIKKDEDEIKFAERETSFKIVLVSAMANCKAVK